MPTYVYQCGRCKDKKEVVKPLAQIDRAEECTGCHIEMSRILCAPAVRGDYEGYRCPVTDKWVEGRRAHEENLKRTGCRVYEPGEKDQMIQRKKADDYAFDKKVEHVVEAEIHSMPTPKREKLVAEVQNGLDVSIVRSSPN